MIHISLMPYRKRNAWKTKLNNRLSFFIRIIEADYQQEAEKETEVNNLK